MSNSRYLIKLITYIHQNPMRAGLIKELKQWPYSSYPDLAGLRNGTLIDKSLVRQNFASVEAFIKFSQKTITKIGKNIGFRDVNS